MACKTRRYPFVLSVFGTVAAAATALYYRDQAAQKHNVIVALNQEDPGVASISFPSELMDEVRKGHILMYWHDESGKKHYKIAYEDSQTENK